MKKKKKEIETKKKKHILMNEIYEVNIIDYYLQDNLQGYNEYLNKIWKRAIFVDDTKVTLIISTFLIHNILKI